jgi:hypothetical protein
MKAIHYCICSSDMQWAVAHAAAWCADVPQYLKALLCSGVWRRLQARVVDQAVQRQPACLEGINKRADGPDCTAAQAAACTS